MFPRTARDGRKDRLGRLQEKIKSKKDKEAMVFSENFLAEL
jgi:hypothetical protein